ncbi:LPS-assembly protein LptD [Rhizobium sp.]
MAAGNRKGWLVFRGALLSAVAACALILPEVTPAFAQATVENGMLKPADGSKLLLTATQLIYDQDAKKIVAVGGVQIHYGGYKLVAKRVEYNQATGRMTAIGDIEMIEPSGNRVYGDKVDVTDNFANGFIEALRIETTDNTRLAAASGERVNSDEMILNKGVYTACEVCKENPEKPPLWQIKAERVIQNGKTRTIRLEQARFELFGAPIAFIPVLQLPDPSVKRKSGFLFPRMSADENLGFGLSIPYYQTLSPSMDATMTVTGYTTQGAMIETEFRQRFKLGEHTLRIAGIDQMRPGAFTKDTADAEVDQRGMVQSKADFKVNPRWSFGWDVMIQSDNNFARTYSLDGLNDPVHTNQTYLTGLGRRNSFDLRSFYFDVQDADPDNKEEKKQAVVYPVFDYTYYHPDSVLGGQLSLTNNITNLSRTNTDRYGRLEGVRVNDRFPGLAGNYTRLTSEAEWKRTFIMPFGLALTPLVAARGDGIRNDMNDPWASYPGDYHSGNTATRTMLTAGLEARYPILMTAPNSSHVIEPIMQVFARPDERMAGALPNEDAQSFVFDASNLFARDKFSGFDRIEGGTRANLGVRYTGTFDSGYMLRGVFGQSFQLAGKNSFASNDLVFAGADSGLETWRSDYVGALGIEAPNGISLALGGRFDEKTLDIKRSDVTVGYFSDWLQSEVTYSQIAAQPLYGFPTENNEVQTTGGIKFNTNWTVYGSTTWDVDDSVLTRRGIGIAYDDSCTVFALAFTQTRDLADVSANDWQVGARISFRTLGDVRVGDTAEPAIVGQTLVPAFQ